MQKYGHVKKVSHDFAVTGVVSKKLSTSIKAAFVRSIQFAGMVHSDVFPGVYIHVNPPQGLTVTLQVSVRMLNIKV